MDRITFAGESELMLSPVPSDGPAILLGGGKLEQVRTVRAEEPPDGEMLRAVRALIQGVGEDTWREGLLDKPSRVAEMMLEVTPGYAVDLDAVLNEAVFEEAYDEPVVVRDMSFYSLCEHHLLPFFGRAHVAYIPQGRVVGLSKIPRVVESFARRLQVQERLTVQVADFLETRLQPRGVAFVLEGTHFCAVMRGVSQPQGVMRTQALRGAFREQPEFLARMLQGIG